jgi:tetraspanin-7
MCIVGVLAMWCTPKGVSWLLHLYSAVIFLLFLAVFTTAILFVVKRDSFEDTIKDGMANAIKTYPNEQLTIDLLQENVHCCGLNNYTDWFTSNWANKSTNVPESCCKPKLDHKCVHLSLTTQPDDIYTNGCFAILHKTIDDKYLLISGIGFGASLIILFGSLLTCCLIQNLKSNRYETVE